jgi:hypothetical protein
MSVAKRVSEEMDVELGEEVRGCVYVQLHVLSVCMYVELHVELHVC